MYVVIRTPSDDSTCVKVSTDMTRRVVIDTGKIGRHYIFGDFLNKIRHRKRYPHSIFLRLMNGQIIEYVGQSVDVPTIEVIFSN